MANILPALVWMFVIQASSTAAPNGDALIVPKLNEEGSKVDSLPPGKDDQSSIENGNNQRQKRFYNYNEFGYSPLGYPSSFPPPLPFHAHFSKRDEGRNTGVYGSRDVLSDIYTRLEEILSTTRQQAYQTPKQTPIPTYIPLLVLPQFGCGCSTNNETPPKREQEHNNNKPQPNIPTESTTLTGETTPGLFNRFNGINDTSSPNEQIYTNGNRPISFDPVTPESPLDVPVPPVEHGSVQAGAQPAQIPTTTVRPIPPPTAFRPIPNSPSIAPPGASIPANQPDIANINSRFPSIAPSACDAAIIRCCIGPQATPNCFTENGCPDPSRYGKPCDPEVIYNVVNKVRHYIQQLRTLT